MNLRTIEIIKWGGLASALISVGAISYIKLTFVFESGNTAGNLLLLSLVTALISILIGLYQIRRWQSSVSFLLLCVVGYLLLSSPLYVVP